MTQEEQQMITLSTEVQHGLNRAHDLEEPIDHATARGVAEALKLELWRRSLGAPAALLDFYEDGGFDFVTLRSALDEAAQDLGATVDEPSVHDLVRYAECHKGSSEKRGAIPGWATIPFSNR